MSANKDAIKSDLAKSDAYVLTPEDYDEIPELTDAFFDSAVMHDNGKVIKRGRPFAEKPKERVTMRLDADVLAFYRATGTGWQSRVNVLLRQAAKLNAKA